MDTRLTILTLAMRIAFGLMATLAGLDKFFNILADWEGYVAPLAASLLPFSTATFMMIVGIVEIAVGITILGVRPALGAYVAAVWLTLVSVNLLMGGFLYIAVRDLVLALSAVTFGRLYELSRPAVRTVGLGMSSGHAASPVR